jgi:Uma2 family endonuclease
MENVETVETLSEEVVSDYEKERGKPMPSFNHGIVQSKLIALLSAKKQFTIGSEITLDLSPKATPDILIFNKRKANWQRDEKRVAEMPLTVIEILSGTQGMDDFEEKLARYFEALNPCGLFSRLLKPSRSFCPTKNPASSPPAN